MLILAIAPKGKEFLYRLSSAHSVPKASADRIRDVLNKAGHKLKDGETWHMYDVGPYDNAYEIAHYQSFRIRTGCVYESIR